MKNNQPNPDDRESKDTHFQIQTQRVFESFSVRPKTMLMVSIETGILRANICRYVAKMEKQGKIQRFKQGLCETSKYHAWYFSTSENL